VESENWEPRDSSNVDMDIDGLYECLELGQRGVVRAYEKVTVSTSGGFQAMMTSMIGIFVSVWKYNMIDTSKDKIHGVH
jgi:hypothetical protein